MRRRLLGAGADVRAPAPPPGRVPTGERLPALDLSAERKTPPPAPSWPDAKCEEAGRTWYAKLQAKRPMGHGYTLDDVKHVATEFPLDFAEAATAMAEGAKGWTGRGDVIAWLRRQCEWAGERREDQAREQAKRRTPPPRVCGPEVRSREGEWVFRWDFGERREEINATYAFPVEEMTLEQILPFVFVARTPAEAFEEPRPLKSVSGALDAYIAKHAADHLGGHAA